MWKPSPTPDDVIMHSAKGSSWKKHKYISIKNGRYIYPPSRTKGEVKTSTRRAKLKEQSDKTSYNFLEEDADKVTAGEKAIDKAQENYKKHSNGGRFDLYRDARDFNKRTVNDIDNGSITSNMTNRPLNKLREEYVKDSAIMKKKADQISASKYKKYIHNGNPEAKKMTDTGTGTGVNRSKQITESNLDRARAKAKRKKIEDVREASSEIRRKQKYNKAMNEAKKEKTTVMREWKRRNAELDYGKGISSMDRAREHEKKSDRANMTYNEGLMRGYDNNKYEKRKGKKVTNPTAKKNQRKAALEKAKYKAKSTLNKVIGKSKSTVTDTFTGKKRPASKSGTTINIKLLSKKNKKKK